MNEKYATVTWTAEDVQTLRPNWTLEKCAEWLDRTNGTSKTASWNSDGKSLNHSSARNNSKKSRPGFHNDTVGLVERTRQEANEPHWESCSKEPHQPDATRGQEMDALFIMCIWAAFIACIPLFANVCFWIFTQIFGIVDRFIQD